MASGQYSVLLRAIFQSVERTLREDEVARWSARIVETLKALAEASEFDQLRTLNVNKWDFYSVMPCIGIRRDCLVVAKWDITHVFIRPYSLISPSTETAT